MHLFTDSSQENITECCQCGDKKQKCLTESDNHGAKKRGLVSHATKKDIAPKYTFQGRFLVFVTFFIPLFAAFISYRKIICKKLRLRFFNANANASTRAKWKRGSGHNYTKVNNDDNNLMQDTGCDSTTDILVDNSDSEDELEVTHVIFGEERRRLLHQQNDFSPDDVVMT